MANLWEWITGGPKIKDVFNKDNIIKGVAIEKEKIKNDINRDLENLGWKTETNTTPTKFTGTAGPETKNIIEKKEEEQQPQENPVDTPPVKDQNAGEGIFDTEPTDEAQNSTAQAFFDYLEKAQNRVEAREDTAYQRAVSDMRKAGINPNLIGAINPAESKGVYAQGITATGNLTATNMQNITKRIMQDIDHIFEQGEHAKELTKDYIISILNTSTKLLSGWIFG